MIYYKYVVDLVRTLEVAHFHRGMHSISFECLSSCVSLSVVA